MVPTVNTVPIPLEAPLCLFHVDKGEEMQTIHWLYSRPSHCRSWLSWTFCYFGDGSWRLLGIEHHR